MVPVRTGALKSYLSVESQDHLQKLETLIFTLTCGAELLDELGNKPAKVRFPITKIIRNTITVFNFLIFRFSIIPSGTNYTLISIYFFNILTFTNDGMQPFYFSGNNLSCSYH